MRKKNLAKRITAIALASAMSISLPGIENIPYMYDSSSVVQAAEVQAAEVQAAEAENVEIYSSTKTSEAILTSEWTTYDNPTPDDDKIKITTDFTMTADIYLNQDVYDNWEIDNNAQYDLKFHGVVQYNEDWTWFEGESCTIKKSDFTNENNEYKATITVPFTLEDKTINDIRGISYKIVANGLVGAVSVKSLKLSKKDDTSKVYYDGSQDSNITLYEEWTTYDNPTPDDDKIKITTDFTMTADIYLNQDVYNNWKADSNAEYDLKFHGVVQYNEDWTWFEGESCTIKKSNFTNENNEYKATITVPFTLEDKTINDIRGISYKIVANGLVGTVSVKSLKLFSGLLDTPEIPPNPTETLKPLYEFTDGLEGWKMDNGYSSLNEGLKMDVTHQNKMLKMSVDYSTATAGWRNAAIYFSNTDGSRLDFTPYNYLSFDLYYDDTKKTKGELVASIDVKDDNGQLSVGTEFNLEKVVLKNIGNQKMANLGFALNQNLASIDKNK